MPGRRSPSASVPCANGCQKADPPRCFVVCELRLTSFAMSQREGRGLRGWASNVVALLVGLVITGVALYATVNASYQLWVQHSGIPAQVEIAKCKTTSRYGRARGLRPKDCTAVWRHTDGTQQTVTVHGPNIAARQTVDVHIRGDQAYTNGPWPLKFLFSGIGLIGIISVLLWRRRRQSRARRSQ